MVVGNDRRVPNFANGQCTFAMDVWLHRSAYAIVDGGPLASRDGLRDDAGRGGRPSGALIYRNVNETLDKKSNQLKVTHEHGSDVSRRQR